MISQARTSDDLTAETSRHGRYREMGWWPGEKLVDRYERHVQASPNHMAVRDDRGNALTHQGLWERAGEMTSEFAARGIGAGDIAVIILPNWIEWQVAHLAIHRLGAIPANIPLRTSLDMLIHAVQLVGACCLIAADKFDNRDTGVSARSAAAACGHRVDVLTISTEGTRSWSGNGGQRQQAKTRRSDLDHIMFTSSTTGMPKAVMHSADTLAAFNISLATRFDLDQNSPVFMASPLGHSVGAIHGARLCLFLGSTLVLQQRWDPQAALALIEEYDCAFTAAATPFLKDLLDAKWASSTPKLATMKAFLCGGAQVPPSMIEQAKTEFPNTFMTVLWGMTEGGMTTCVPGTSSNAQMLNTTGAPTLGFELRILGPDDQILSPDEEGELVVRGPCMFIGYFGQDAFYAEQLTPDGFFRTGDLATLDADGYVRITGRLKDLIIRAGVNISPVPIEDVLAGHGEIKSIAVIGFPDERLGERICAVVLSENPALKLEDLTSFAQDKGLPKHFMPERIVHIQDMPMTPAGKIRKNDVRAWLGDRIKTGEVVA